MSEWQLLVVVATTAAVSTAAFFFVRSVARAWDREMEAHHFQIVEMEERR